MKYLNKNNMIFAVGLLCGLPMLESAYAARPPFDWPIIIFVFLCTLLGVPFVIGIQLFRNDPKFARLAISWFGSISIFVFASGLSAFAIELYKKGITPQGMFFMALGASLFISIRVCGVLAEIKGKKFEYQKQKRNLTRK